MLNRKYSMLLAAAAAAAVPMTANAVLITFSFNTNDIMVATTGAGPFVTASSLGFLSGTAAAPIVTVPSGDFIQIGVNGMVTGDTAAPDTGNPTGALGIAAYQIGLADSNLAVASVAPYNSPAGTTISTVVVNPNFISSAAKGLSDGLGGVNAQLGTLGANSFNGTAYTASKSYGANVPAELYNSERLKANGSAGTSATFTLTNNPTAFQYVALQTPGSTTGSGAVNATTYKNVTFNATTDTFAPMPTLTVLVAGGVTSTTTSTTSTSSSSTSVSHQPIVSLMNTAPTTYGNQIGTPIVITGGGGYYTIGTTGAGATNASAGVATGFTRTSSFNPLTDTEIYALKVDSNGTMLTAAQIQAIVTDINAGTGGGTAASNVSASTITGVFASLFPASQGYDVLLTSTAGFTAATGGVSFLGIDFTQLSDPALPGLTVFQVAAVPEPATAAVMILGASGLLLGRRKNKIEAA